MTKLEQLTGLGPHRVYISTVGQKNILGVVTNEDVVLRTPCRKGWAVLVDGEWRESRKDGALK